MKHTRADYARFQDPANKIPEDEPVMLFRGQDVLAAATLRFYAHQCETHGLMELARITMGHADLMDAWKYHKLPDLPGDIYTEIKALNEAMPNMRLVPHDQVDPTPPREPFIEHLTEDSGRQALDPDRPFMEQMAEQRARVPIPPSVETMSETVVEGENKKA